MKATADEATPVESARAMRDELERLGLTNLTYVAYPGLDHHLRNEAGEDRLIDQQQDAYGWMTDRGLLQIQP